MTSGTQTDQQLNASALPKTAQAPIAYAVLLLAFMGQMLLNPIIAPLSRQLGMKEWHIGATISLAAIMLALTSPFWGKFSQRHGVKKTLIIAMSIAMIALVGVAAIAFMGMRGFWVGSSMVIGFMFARGLIYGCSISAVSPTVQTHLVSHTVSEPQRVKAVGGIGAVTALASIIGAIVGGGLAVVGGFLFPLVVMPLLMLLGIAVLVVFFRPDCELKRQQSPKSISYFDPRAFPFLVSGLSLFLVFSTMATLFGFLIQDRFGLAAERTAAITAAYMVGISVIMIVAQAGLASKIGWNSVQLLRGGLVLSLVGLIIVTVGHSHLLLACGVVLFALGTGLAVPGYNAGPTMEMSSDEQGGLAGLINSNNGVAYAIAPIGSTALYGINEVLPLVVCGALLVIISCFSFTHPKFRQLNK